jgi:hypothetical protein
VAVNELESEIDHTEPLVLGGLDMKVRLNDQFFLVPGVRGGFIFRNDKLTYFPSNLPGRGGPDERAKSLLVISVTAFYRF